MVLHRKLAAQSRRQTERVACLDIPKATDSKVDLRHEIPRLRYA
jgi:hypothetical protein